MSEASGRTWIALFRGINVGGRNRLPMARLCELLEALGFDKVRSYIQSGNVVFIARGERKSLTRIIRDAVEDSFGFEPEVMLLRTTELAGIEQRNPFPEAVCQPASLHVWFLEGTPRAPDLERLASFAVAEERFALLDGALFLHAPAGIGRSKLAARVEDCLGVQATSRNWRTVSTLLKMLE